MNVCFETFGCRLNRAEALEDEAKAIAAGNTVVKEHSKADVIIIRGCSVTGKAQHECEHFIEHLKKHYPNKRIWKTGCLKDSKPFVIKSEGIVVPMRTARAYLKVQDGCNSSCTFCTVPKFRGKSVSVPFDEVVKKAQAFVAAGYHEIVVTGCNLVQYHDSEANAQLTDLVSALCAINPEVRVRLGSIEPGVIAYKLVDLMKATPNLCKFLHLSIQSGSDKVLMDMRRPYKTKELAELLGYAQKEMPLLSIGCDLIAGFPTEEEMDYRLTQSLFSRFNITRAHVFPYSERPGTVAAARLLQVPKEVRRHRAHRIAALSDENGRLFKKKFVGREVEVVIETSDEHTPAGWTSEYIWCEFPNLKGRKGLRRTIVRGHVYEVTGDGFRAR